MTDPARHRRVIERRGGAVQRALVRREDGTDSLACFWVRFDGEPTPFEAGQYMTIGVMVDGRIVQRPYSVASAADDAGDDGYESTSASSRADVHAAPVELPIGQGMRMIGPRASSCSGRTRT